MNKPDGIRENEQDDERGVQKDKAKKIDILAEISLRPFPFLSMLSIVVPAIFLIWMHFTPAVLRALQRDPQALAQGQWWRLLSPLLVDSDGLSQFVTVSIGFLCVGVPAEHWLGRWRWLLLFFVGALAGEAAGYIFQPYGGGNSITMFGILGGSMVLLLSRKHPVLLLPGLFALFEIGSLVGTDISGLWLAVVLCVVFAVVFQILFRRDDNLRILVWFANGVCLLGSVTLLVLHDIHGAALLAGMLAGAVLAWLDPKFQSATARRVE